MTFKLVRLLLQRYCSIYLLIKSAIKTFFMASKHKIAILYCNWRELMMMAAEIYGSRNSLSGPDCISTVWWRIFMAGP